LTAFAVLTPAALAVAAPASAANIPPTIGMHATTAMDLDRSYSVGADSWDEEGKAVTLDFDLDGDGSFETPGTISDGYQKRSSAYTHVTFRAPGDHLLRARATDDQGATAIATLTVQVSESEPWAYLNVTGGDFDKAPVAGQPVTVEAYSIRPGAKYEFDLDGDGTYELDKGATSKFETSLTAGTHSVGARITDTRGGVTEQRITTFVYEPADTFGDKYFARRFEVSATVGVPKDLTINVEPYTRAYTVEWDADGDGDFDDGTFTTPGGTGPDSSLGHNTYTYAAPGVYDQRVRVSRAGLPTRIFSSKIFVSTQTDDRTPSYVSFGSGFAIKYGEPSGFEAVTSSGFGTPTLSFDLDGDGEFDDTPSYDTGLYYWTFNAPVIASVKATDPVSGKSVVGTMQVQPGNLPDREFSPIPVDKVATTPPADGPGGTPPILIPDGERTISVRITRTKIGALLKRGLVVNHACAATCRLNVVIAVDKATAKRLTLRSTLLGTGSGSGSKLTVHLNAKARKALRTTRSVKLRVAITATAADGRVGTSSTSLTIKK
jgi:hypothetical protein